jgi:hypothetical protein
VWLAELPTGDPGVHLFKDITDPVLRDDQAWKQFSKKQENDGKKIESNKKKQQLTKEQKFKNVFVAARKGNPLRVLTSECVHSVLHLRQIDAAKRLCVSQSVLKKTCKNFGIKWPRHFPSDIMSDPVVKTPTEILP